MLTPEIIDIPTNDYHLPAKSMILGNEGFLRGRQLVPFLVKLDQEEYSCLKSDKDYFDEEMQKEINDRDSYFKAWGGAGAVLSGCGGGLITAANPKKQRQHENFMASGVLLATLGVTFLAISFLIKSTAFPKEAAKEIAINRLIRLNAKERAIEKRLSELEDNSDNAHEIEQLTQAKQYCELVRTVWDRGVRPH